MVKDQVSDTVADGEPRVTTYDYDLYNRVEKVTDAHDHETAYDYDRFGNVVAMVDAADNRYEYAYTSRNSLAEVRLRDFDGDPEGAPGTGDYLVVNRYLYDYAGRLASDIDAMGRKVDYTYYGDGLPKSTILRDFRNPDETKRDYIQATIEHDGAVNPTRQTSANGMTVVENVYDRVGRLESATLDPGRLNRRLAYRYDAAGNVTKETRSGNASNVTWATPAVGDSVDYTYDGPGRMTTATVTDGTTSRVTGYAYDQRDLLTAVTDPRGNAPGADKTAFTTTYTNDELGRLIKTTSPPVAVENNGGQPATARPETVAGYNAFDEQTEVKDPNGNTSRTEYDRLGQPVKQIAPAYSPPGSTTQLTPTTVTHYDPLGRVSKVVDPRQNDVRYSYDRLGRVNTVDEPHTSNDDRVQWRYTYTRTGEVLSTIDPTGARTEATYDDLGRPVTSTRIERRPTPAAYTSRAGYDDVGNLLTTTSPTGVTTTSTYDTLGQLTKTVDGAGVTSQVGYDHAGRQVRSSDALNRTTRLTYDPFGDLVRTTDLKPDGTGLRERSSAYDLSGNPTRTTDAFGRSTTFQYDSLSRLVKQVEPVGDTESITTTFGYDAAGNRTRFTDGRGNSTVYTVNSLGLAESITEPATAAHPQPSDRTWTTSYDEAGNPVKITAPGGIIRRRTFDPAQRLLTETGSGTASPTAERTLAYDAAGRLTKVGSGTGTNLYSYSDRGLLLSADGPSGSASWDYNGDGQMTTRTDASGAATFGYAGGRLRTVQDGITGTTQTIGYNPAGQPNKIDYGAGRLRTAGYDDLGRPVTDTLENGQGSVAASITYNYDDNDRLTGKTTAGLAGAGENTYGYDHAGRLTSWSYNGTETLCQWDAAGNRTKAGAASATYDERNRRLTDGNATFAYTPRGTLATGTGTDYTFDAFDRLLAAGNTTYTYDALDRVATRNDIALSYAGLEKDPVRDGVNGYARGPSGGLLATGGVAGPRITLSDRRGDVIGGFAPDNTLGSVTESTAYEPFGQPMARSGGALGIGYQGDWTDPGTGQVNMHARWYEPKSGAFTSRDDWTLDPAGGSIGANRYTYANGDPLNITDPTGHWGIPLGGLVRRVGRAIKRIVQHFRPGPDRWIVKPEPPNYPPDGCGGNCNDRRGSGGGNSGGGGGGGGVGHGPSRSGSSAAAVAAARHRAQQARTDAAKGRERRKAQRVSVPIPQKVRGPGYADQRQRISTGPGRAPGRTGASHHVVRDTEGSLTDLRKQAVAAVGDPVGTQGPAAQGPPAAGGSGASGSGGEGGGGGTHGFFGWGSTDGQGKHSWEKTLKQVTEFTTGLSLALMGATTPLGPILMIPGVKDALMKPVGLDADSGAFKAGEYAFDAVSLVAGGGTGAVKVGGKLAGKAGDFLAGGLRPCTTKNSFVTGTPVLMADGNYKSIEDVDVGDEVLAADPETGKEQGRRVTALIPGEGTKNLVKITIDTDGTRGDKTGTITATDEHPFWVEGNRGWTKAIDLKPGMWLRTSAGTHVQITATKTWKQSRRVHNLTVEIDHTYHVQGGERSVLVHNCADDIVEFVHGTRARFADDIEVNGVTEAALRKNDKGSRRSGSFHTFKLDPAEPVANIQQAHFWGQRVNVGQGEVCVIVCRLPRSVVDELEEGRLLLPGGIEGEWVFKPGAFDVINRYRDDWEYIRWDK
ncbi:RHS repeat-associated core domain-containing protein [Actinomadura rugatobispora]|uniref:RHS repeat-associated core domain-containing protein n=1 Tax=Actinomadura rugatobispora TaxID=1994 RepID=A0ABW1A470_9ACTN|nr:hypothetical protein GCM10010200_084020 [Actinomadura rugatobispora]